MEVLIGVSNRHVHLTKEHLEILFGKDFELQKIKSLNQPNQYVSNSFVTLITNKNYIDNVRVIGPVREYTQVEISKTDAYFLGINPPVRSSGDLTNSSPIKIKGPRGIIDLNEGCIIADRHIHITPKQIEIYNLRGKESVNVMLRGEKGGIIKNVKLKISEESFLELHLDTDDANAHLVKQGDLAYIIEDN